MNLIFHISLNHHCFSQKICELLFTSHCQHWLKGGTGCCFIGDVTKSWCCGILCLLGFHVTLKFSCSTWRHGISLSTLYRRSMLCPGYSLLVTLHIFPLNETHFYIYALIRKLCFIINVFDCLLYGNKWYLFYYGASVRPDNINGLYFEVKEWSLIELQSALDLKSLIWLYQLSLSNDHLNSGNVWFA